MSYSRFPGSLSIFSFVFMCHLSRPPLFPSCHSSLRPISFPSARSLPLWRGGCCSPSPLQRRSQNSLFSVLPAISLLCVTYCGVFFWSTFVKKWVKNSVIVCFHWQIEYNRWSCSKCLGSIAAISFIIDKFVLIYHNAA